MARISRIAAFAALPLLLVLPGGDLPAEERGLVAIDQALRDLASDLRVACLAAHPDDEDGETLALLRMKHGVETTIVCFTRGEGGQNEIGQELYQALGAIRTRETRAAAEILGAKVRFLDLPDFGFSKSAEEAFDRWGREETLRRLVRVLREIRPHVVITNHAPTGGHGHHQAAGTVAVEAFDAAADPKRFPEAGEPWAVKKLFVASEPEEATARPPVGEVDPARGYTYAEIALRSLKMHRSQGTWDFVKLEPGPRFRHYRLVKSRVEGGEESILAGLPVPRPELLTEERRTGTRAEIANEVLTYLESPEADPPAREKLSRALAAALGVRLELSLGPREPAVGESGTMRATVWNGGDRKLVLEDMALTMDEEIRVAGPELAETALPPGGSFSIEIPYEVDRDAAPSRPLRDHLIEKEELRHRATLSARLRIDGREDRFTLRETVTLPVNPRLTLRVEPWGRLVRPILENGRIFLLIRNHTREELSGPVQIRIESDRLNAEPPERVTVPAGSTVTVGVTIRTESGVAEGLSAIEVEFLGVSVRDRLRIMEVEVPADLDIAVVKTYGDEVYRSLGAMAIKAELLSDLDLEAAFLPRYQTIVLGIRPYLSRPVLRRMNDRLLRFVEEGGNLVVQYSKTPEWSPDYSPFLLEIGRDRVTREDAPIVFEERDHRLLNFPNEVTDGDFDGWVQERGLYFPSKWDTKAFKVIFSTSDPGERLLPGLLIARYGKGTYVYTSLSWYRQLRELNPAALKVLGNMVSLPYRY